ncbi:MAG: hypothetical protein PHS14_21020, partial [Elusimicrobia bacterium]|nr:hypothetical protein [Elusimicrobiota bacterium]
MPQAIAATVPHELAARKLGEWLSKIVHRVSVEKTGAQWSIMVPQAALSRARRALSQVIVAANPPPARGGKCCRVLGKSATCAHCGRHAHFTVGWLLPSRTQDPRAACSMQCAVALKKGAKGNPLNELESKGILGEALDQVSDHKRIRGKFPTVALGAAHRAMEAADIVAAYGPERYRRVAKRIGQKAHGMAGRVSTSIVKAMPDTRYHPIANPSRKVREARVAKVKVLLVRIKAILQAGEQHLRMGRRKEALESSRRADALWEQMPKGVAMVSPETRREAYELSRRGIRLRNGQVSFNRPRGSRRNGGRFLIQGLRPKHRNWVTIDYADDENRAILNALHRARLGDVAYRVWDTETVSEVWQGKGKEAKVERWAKGGRPAGLVGANRRTPMHRNPRISRRMQPLREHTMRLGDAMKWGRKLLDAGVPFILWDGSGWEVHLKPDDSMSTSSGRAAAGARAYLARGAGLIKTWPITMVAEKIAGGWIDVPRIKHFLAHRKAGVASNPGACRNPLCQRTRRNSGGNGTGLHIGDRVRLLASVGFAGAGSFTGKYAKGDHIMVPPVRELETKHKTTWVVKPGEVGVVTAIHRWPNTVNYIVKFKRGYSILGRKSVEPVTGPAKNRGARRNSASVSENTRIAHEQIVGAFLAGRAKRIGPRYWTDGQLLRVWGNLVAKKVPGGVDIMDAGYRTLLTKNVLNTVLRHLGHDSIWQQARRWYISTPQGKVEWPGEWTIPTGGAAANPRVRAWNIVAYIPGKRERWVMQSNLKDKKNAEATAKVYRSIAKKERRKHRYVVEPFRYTDSASRMKSRRNPVEGWVVTRDGETLKTGFKNHLAAMGWLHRHTSTSVDHAVKHEGYD